ncbi:hypothetical protein [Bdellovibrio sp. KM01]|uniref:hypothetical protein n=1 Tax=Bdellovibrio sp. KM01 TaxID=2748865 RepID=UPI0015E9A29B|nr:hypothetical protein [Bdellovibrio sp. KM01]QLY23957.1 hypothetical protein HW988_10740 [Bdellovibrio sp. KM01]
MRTQFKDKGLWLSSMVRLFTGVFLFSLTFSVLSRNETLAAESCSRIFTNLQKAELKQGALFIHEKDSKLHVTPFVEKTVQKTQRSLGVTLSKPADKLDAWLGQLAKVAAKAGNSNYARDQVKEILRNQYVMKPLDVPESYYAQQMRIAKERGHGEVQLNAQQRVELAATVIKDQQQSLDLWVDHLVSKDTQVYPMWLKYWMFTGMTKLSKFDGESGSFGNRSKETVAPYVEVNHEALAYVADAVVRKVNKKSLADIEDPVFLKALEGVSFGKLYGQALFKLGVGREGSFATNEGQWVRYDRGSDHMPLVKSLEGRNTGWCTSGEATAQRQLSGGDFYVYYSKDGKGQSVLPRVAIRMDGDQIAEVRGVGKDQNLDSQILATSIVSDKVNSFGDRGAAFLQKDADMKKLTAIEKKFRLGQALKKDELVFLREVERPIQGFGHQKDPRIDEILSNRDLKEDYVLIFDGHYKKEEIALSAAEFINAGKNFKVLVGNLVILESSQKMPELLHGDLSFMRVDSAEGMVFPRKVTGNLILDDVIHAQGVKLPLEVGGNIQLRYLKQAQGLVLPTIVNGNLDLQSLRSAEGITFPKTVKGYLRLDSLKK